MRSLPGGEPEDPDLAGDAVSALPAEDDPTPPAEAGPALPGEDAPALPSGHLDAKRLVAAAAGDGEALRWLLDEVAPVVYGYLYARVGGDQPAAEDLLQETLLEAVRGASAFRGESAASTWMCAIARRRLSRHYEAERRREAARRSLRLVKGGQLAGPERDPAEVLAERQDEVVRALGCLPALQRQVLVLKYLEGMPVLEIAHQVNRSRIQVQSLLQRGRDGLRRQLGGLYD